MRRIVWVLFSSFCALSVYGQSAKLDALQAKIQKTGSTWVAGETKMSALSRADQLRYLGANIPQHGDYFFSPVRSKTTWAAPSSFDWRDQGGVNYSSPILDQGRCGSCVAFAAVGQLETQMNIARKTPDSPWAYSPQHLFSCGGGGCETGWMPMSALSFLQSDGVPDEACFPYESGATGNDQACTKSCSDSKARSSKIVRYTTTSFFFASVDTIKKALQKGPLLATMIVYDDFMYYKSGVYKHTTGEQLGGHAVTIVGWNDTDKAWIVRNSWGEDFGEKGYFRVAWNDASGVGNSTWGIEVPSADGFVSLGSLRDHTVLSGSHVVQLESTFADTQKINWQMLRGTSKVAEGTVTRSSSVTVNTSTMADGVYDIVAVAERSAGIVRSQPRTVYVLNGKLTGSLNIKNAKDGDTLSGKQVLEFGVTSSPVPFSKLTFRARNLSTGTVVERSTPNVASQTNMSFNTEAQPNGDWELSLEGIAGTQSIKSAPVKITIKN